MIKINSSDKKFLEAFSKSNEWAILKARLVAPLLQDIESVNSTFKFEEGLTTGEKFAGRQMASKFAGSIIKIIEQYGNATNKQKKPQDFFE